MNTTNISVLWLVCFVAYVTFWFLVNWRQRSLMKKRQRLWTIVAVTERIEHLDFSEVFEAIRLFDKLRRAGVSSLPDFYEYCAQVKRMIGVQVLDAKIECEHARRDLALFEAAQLERGIRWSREETWAHNRFSLALSRLDRVVRYGRQFFVNVTDKDVETHKLWLQSGF
jgi:hypothetical protein